MCEPSLSDASVLFECFGELDDPRVVGRTSHDLIDIIAIALCTVLCGGEHWTDMENFGRAKEDWLRGFLRLRNGIPSHYTFGRVFTALAPQSFQACFVRWTDAVRELFGAEVIAVDGKTARRSHDHTNGKQAIHMVSAWATQNRMVLGQVKVDDKSNEITAIPELLKALELSGCIVTIDAMGCQSAIAKTIVEAGADYILAVKGNQNTLEEDVHLLFEDGDANGYAHMQSDLDTTLDKDHGRIEQRECRVIRGVNVIDPEHRWPKLSAVARVRSKRTHDGQTSEESRYYILSLEQATAKKALRAVRSRWGIENTLHWTLDVAFNEDQCRIRAGHAAQNFTTMRHIALNLIKRDCSRKGGVKAKRLMAAIDTNYLERLITQD